MPKLQNKSALVTGGARGIGEAIARCFVREGAQVVIAGMVQGQAHGTMALHAGAGAQATPRGTPDQGHHLAAIHGGH